MLLQVTGERVVTAADIMAPSTVEIVNPDLHIATLDNENARLEMELVVETGRGYVPADSREDQPIGVIPVDAIYTPVQKVNYTVEHTRVGQMTRSEERRAGKECRGRREEYSGEEQEERRRDARLIL